MLYAEVWNFVLDLGSTRYLITINSLSPNRSIWHSYERSTAGALYRQIAQRLLFSARVSHELRFIYTNITCDSAHTL